MKKSTISGLIYIIIGVVIIVAVFQYIDRKDRSNHPLVSEVVQDLTDINTLVIDSTITKIEISETNESVFSANLEQSIETPFTLLTNVKNNTLTLEVKSKNSSFSFINLNNIGKKIFGTKLNVKIPKHYKGNLKLSTSTGSTEILSLNVDSVSIDSTTGTLKLNNINSNQLTVESTTGTIHINDTIANKLKVESTTGTIHLNNNNLAAFDVESTTGSIHLNQDNIVADSKLSSTTGSIHVSLNETPTSLNVAFESSTGKAHIKTKGYNMIKSSRNDQEFQYGSGEASLKVETTTGSFHFE